MFVYLKKLHWDKLFKYNYKMKEDTFGKSSLGGVELFRQFTSHIVLQYAKPYCSISSTYLNTNTYCVTDVLVVNIPQREKSKENFASEAF